MKASPAARSWMAAGVRQEIFTRALPALRHDMVAPASVLRMTMLVLRRQMAEPPVDVEAAARRVALVDDQVGQIVAGARSLREWEIGGSEDHTTRAELVARCVGLMRVAFELQGIGLEADPALMAGADEGEGGEERLSNAAALRYLLLGALGYLHDRSPAPGAIRIEPEGPQGLRLVALDRQSDVAEPVTRELRAPRALAIDAIALQALADDLGLPLTSDGALVRLGLVPAGG